MREETFDVIVIGGGVTGAGAALDAATRGLSVALLERGDLASGTSSRSGKSLHGGLRYLEQGNLSLVRQAAHERNLMVERLCPHLTRPTPFMFPLTHRVWERAYMGLGLTLYDRLGGARGSIPRHRHLSKRDALRACPALRADRVVGALQYHDVVVDDARHTMIVARTAAHYGAAVATHVEVTGLARVGTRVSGVRGHDRQSGEAVEIRGRSVINATGACAAQVQRLAGAKTVELRPSKGVHLVVPHDCFRSRVGLVTRAGDNVLVVRPWNLDWIIGTTDTPWHHASHEPVANAADVDFLLGAVNRWLRAPLARTDVLGVYAGIRPLIGVRVATTAALHRDHLVAPGPAGLFTIVGGKYTTYRLMARDVVDAAAASLGRSVGLCVTDTTPLLGADGYAAMWEQRARLARPSGLDTERIETLLGRYGALVDEMLELIRERPQLQAPLRGAPDRIEAEIVYAATHEGALHLDDVLERRTHIAIETHDRGLKAAPRIADLLGGALGWTRTRRVAELTRYEARVAAALHAEQECSDDAAVAAGSASGILPG
jgi:glycerol-3-phosphate dehydrogenase